MKFVYSRIFYGIVFVMLISNGIAFAEEPLVSVQTDDNSYNEGDIIVISGKVSIIVDQTPATVQIYSDENLVEIAQITIAQDGSYSHTIVAEGQYWQNQGNYTARVTYGEGNTVETQFSYLPKSESIETTNNFEVDAGNMGTFDIEYTIKGATVKNMVIDSNNFALIIQIESTDDGSIILDLPRDYIGAENQEGRDVGFIIRINNTDIKYEEAVVHSESRILTINFEQGDSDIMIIGTYVVPEFGTIVMMILAISIMSMILVTKNKFQMNV